MEKEPQFNSNESQEKEKYGKNVQINLIFLRHGEKAADGSLTEEGKKQATDFGANLENKDALKGYSSPIARALETVERAIASAPHDKKLKTRIRTELGIRPCSPEFFQKFKEKEKEGPSSAADWYLSFGEQKPDAETTSPREIAEDFAYALSRYMRMADKLYSGSEEDLINGTHQATPEMLLKEIMVREKDGQKVVGFESLEEIGGSLKPTESIKFLIKNDESGKKEVRLHFREEDFDIDKDRLEELVKDYKHRQKKDE